MKKFLYFVPAILFYLLIFLLSSRDLGIKIDSHNLDKAAHAIEFTIMAFLLSLGFFNVLKASTPTKIIVTFFLGLILAVLNEFQQYYVPRRSSDAWDVLADALGVACGIIIYWYLEKKRKQALIP